MKEYFCAESIIAKKLNKESLSSDEIKWFISGLISSEVADYQMTALLSAIFINGLSEEETAALTNTMLHSGEVLKFDDQTVVDKHSTGGVGDKTSFILAPIAAACGVKVPMITGRGLGHTGGTTDKIESVSGFNTSLSLEKFVKQVQEYGIAIIGQTKEIAPADKRIYALRHATSTVASIPLITASIMSKKLAEGASGIVMDVKWGGGAFMRTKEEAEALAESLAQTAIRCDHNIMTFITDMNQPLGSSIGNSLELIECVEILKGKDIIDYSDTRSLSIQLAGAMIFLGGLSKDHDEGIEKARAALEDGRALEKFRKLIKLQGGDDAFIDDYSKLPTAAEKTLVTANKDGHIGAIDTKNLGLHCFRLSGGGKKVDHAPGLVLHHKLGGIVKKGDPLVTIHHHADQKELADLLAVTLSGQDIKIDGHPPKGHPLVFATKVYQKR